MALYPLSLSLEKFSCLVVGAGEVGLRKITALLAASAESITVIEPQANTLLQELAKQHSAIKVLQRIFQPDDVQGNLLVFAATSNMVVNASIGSLCAEKGILCNIADDTTLSSFIVPASFQCEGILIALSTFGASPALARMLRQELEVWFGSRFTKLIILLKNLRPLLLDLSKESTTNRDIFRTLVHSKELLEALNSSNKENALVFLKHSLPKPLHPKMGEILNNVF